MKISEDTLRKIIREELVLENNDKMILTEATNLVKILSTPLKWLQGAAVGIPRYIVTGKVSPTFSRLVNDDARWATFTGGRVPGAWIDPTGKLKILSTSAAVPRGQRAVVMGTRTITALATVMTAYQMESTTGLGFIGSTIQWIKEGLVGDRENYTKAALSPGYYNMVSSLREDAIWREETVGTFKVGGLLGESAEYQAASLWQTELGIAWKNMINSFELDESCVPEEGEENPCEGLYDFDWITPAELVLFTNVSRIISGKNYTLYDLSALSSNPEIMPTALETMKNIMSTVGYQQLTTFLDDDHENPWKVWEGILKNCAGECVVRFTDVNGSPVEEMIGGDAVGPSSPMGGGEGSESVRYSLGGQQHTGMRSLRDAITSIDAVEAWIEKAKEESSTGGEGTHETNANLVDGAENEEEALEELDAAAPQAEESSPEPEPEPEPPTPHLDFQCTVPRSENVGTATSPILIYDDGRNRIKALIGAGRASNVGSDIAIIATSWMNTSAHTDNFMSNMAMAAADQGALFPEDQNEVWRAQDWRRAVVRSVSMLLTDPFDASNSDMINSWNIICKVAQYLGQDIVEREVQSASSGSLGTTPDPYETIYMLLWYGFKF